MPIDSSASELQFDRIGFLPLDVINIIFSYIDQRDCLTCVTVCRDWYALIPQYTAHAWATVEFSTDEPTDENPGRYRFLGNHVKSIILDEYLEDELYTIVKKLISCGCNSVQTLELLNCGAESQGTFLRLLKELGPTLTRLRMTNHKSNVPLHHILSVSPELQHFTYQASSSTYDEYGTYDQEPSVHHSIGKPLDTFTHLVTLCLDSLMDKKLRLEPILKKCPNLRHFVGASSNTYYGTSLDRYNSPPYEARAIDLDKLLLWCPKITNLAVNSGYHWLHGIESDLENEATIDAEKGIHHLRLCHRYNKNQIIPLLTKNQHLLELVSVSNENSESGGFDCSPIFGPLHMPQLHTLNFSYVDIDGTTIVKLLNHCPLVSTLTAIGKSSIVFDASVIQGLQPTQALRSLECINWKIQDKNDVLALLLERLPSLKNLSIKFSSLMVDIPRILDCLKQLTHLELCDVKVMCKDKLLGPSKLKVVEVNDAKNFGHDLLSMLAPMSTLNHISVGLGTSMSANEENDMHRFAELIHGENLTTLELQNVLQMPFTLLDKLGDLPRLEMIKVSAPYSGILRKRITMRSSMSGVLRLLEKTTSLESLSLEETVLYGDQKIYTYDEVVDLFHRRFQNYDVDCTAADEDEGEYSKHQILQSLDIELSADA